MAEIVDSLKYPSLPSNYVTIAHLQERWLKQKQRKQQQQQQQQQQQEEEKEKQEYQENKQYPVAQNHRNRIVNGGRNREYEGKEQYPVAQYSRNRIVNGGCQAPVGKNRENVGKKQCPVPQNGKNYSGKSWREVGLVAKEPKLKEVDITASVVEEGEMKKKKQGYFVKRKPWVKRGTGKFSSAEVGEEEMVGVENGGKGSYKGKCKEVEEVAATVWAAKVVGRSNVGREIEGQECGVGFRGKKHSGRRMGDGVGEVSEKGDGVEQCGYGAFCAYGDKEVVAAVCAVEVVGESSLDREIAGQKCGVGFRGKRHSRRRMGDGVGDSVEQSGQECNGEKVRMRGAFCAYGDKEVEASVCAVEVVGESNVDREIAGKKCGVGFRGKKNSRGRMGDGTGQVSDKMNSVEQSGKQYNAEKEEVSVDMKERTNEKVVGESNVDREMAEQRYGVGFRGRKNSSRKMGDKIGELSDKVYSMERSGQERNGEKKVVSVVGENEADREIAGQKCRVGFRGKKNSRRRMGDGQVSYKIDSGEQSGKQHNAEEEECSVDVKERTNEKVKVSGAFRAYGDKEVEEVATVCMVEVVGENKVDREITGQKGRVGFRGKKHGWRKIGYRVGEVSDKANSAEQSGRERNAEKEKVSVDVKERIDEKMRVKGAFCAYGDKSIDLPLIESGAGLKMMIQRDLGDLSLTDRRYGHGRSSVRVYGDKWRYGSSRKYEPRKILNQKDNCFVWIKKGESSNGNVAEIVTQVDVSSQSTKSE